MKTTYSFPPLIIGRFMGQSWKEDLWRNKDKVIEIIIFILTAILKILK